jgi:cytochrome c oxidase subunit I
MASSHAHDGKNYLNHETTIWSWLTTIDHKRIGLMYLVTMMLFFAIGGLAALMMRLELAHSGEDFITAQQYNALFTVHGAVMIFLFIVPGIPAILGNILLPLMIGAKDVAFPRLNLLSYYVYLVGALIAVVGLLNPAGPWGFAPNSPQWVLDIFAALGLTGPIDTGWTFYAPYSLETSSAVVWLTFAAFVLGFSSILTGLNFIVTVHKLRAPGLTWNRLSVFVWAIYATAIIQTLATPVVGISLVLIIMERVMGLGVFDPTLGGDPVLFEHLFWFYSHPVVYIMVLPAFGIMGEIIPVFSRKPLFGYKAVCYASLCIAMVGFLIWAHHMFVSGISDASATYFSIATFGVAVPTAVKVFNWVSTMYKGSIEISAPMLYAMGFVFLFLIAGTTGVYLAALAVDVFYHDTYFVVAHFHYTIQGGAVIGLIAGLHFWFPKMSGKMYNEYMAKVAWVLIFVGFNLTFIPQFILGMQGMPRRYFDYPINFQPMHQLSSVGAFINAFGYALSILNLAYAFFYSKKEAGPNPYNSLGLEWQTSSPPPHENFHEVPVVTEYPYAYGTPVKH